MAAGTDIVLAGQPERLDDRGSLGEFVDALAVDDNFFAGFDRTVVVYAGLVKDVVGLGGYPHVIDRPGRGHLGVSFSDTGLASHLTFGNWVTLRQVDGTVGDSPTAGTETRVLECQI